MTGLGSERVSGILSRGTKLSLGLAGHRRPVTEERLSGWRAHQAHPQSAPLPRFGGPPPQTESVEGRALTCRLPVGKHREVVSFCLAPYSGLGRGPHPIKKVTAFSGSS